MLRGSPARARGVGGFDGPRRSAHLTWLVVLSGLVGLVTPRDVRRRSELGRCCLEVGKQAYVALGCFDEVVVRDRPLVGTCGLPEGTQRAVPALHVNRRVAPYGGDENTQRSYAQQYERDNE